MNAIRMEHKESGVTCARMVAFKTGVVELEFEANRFQRYVYKP